MTNDCSFLFLLLSPAWSVSVDASMTVAELKKNLAMMSGVPADLRVVLDSIV